MLLWGSIGLLAFVTIALLGFLEKLFFKNFLSLGEPFHLHSAGTIPFSDIAICFIVAGGLFAVFIALVQLPVGHSSKQGDKS
jgi:hypothetical protein